MRVDGLAWGPRGGPAIVAGISFAVAPGSITAVVGANGAGKSTLLRCLYRQNRPTAGTVSIDGHDLWGMSPRTAARKIAAVLQEAPADFPFLVRDVVASGRLPHRRGLFGWNRQDAEIAETMIERFDLAALADQPYARLSGGEKQRVLLARALAQEPGLIVLDEPTNHLDIRHQLEIVHLLRGLDATIVTTLHDLELAAEIADQVLVLRDGRAVGCGHPDDVLIPALIRRAFDVEADIRTEPPGGAPNSGGRRFTFRLPGTGRTVAGEAR